ncbi:hypothetical protein H1R20_g4102, partial [Candolleomyces eurysporus]
MSAAEVDSTLAVSAQETTADDETTAAGNSRLDGMRAILTRALWMWDNGQVLTCAFVETPGNDIQQSKVISIAKEWERYANIKLDFESTAKNPEEAIIRISFSAPGFPTWSHIGKTALAEIRGRATMGLGQVYPHSANANPAERGVILHEFGHALGYLDEHQSPRRGDKLKLKEKEAIEFFKSVMFPSWTEEDTRRFFLNVYNQREVSNYSSVDLTSIMMYFMPAELNEQGIEIPPNYELSALDKAFAFLNYPFLGGPAPDASHTLDNALDTIGVTGKFRESITAEFNENDWRGVRAEFARWALNAKAEASKEEAVAEREAEAGFGVQTGS